MTTDEDQLKIKQTSISQPEVYPQGPVACRYISAYLAIDRRYMIDKSSVIAMGDDAGPYGIPRQECSHIVCDSTNDTPMMTHVNH